MWDSKRRPSPPRSAPAQTGSASTERKRKTSIADSPRGLNDSLDALLEAEKTRKNDSASKLTPVPVLATAVSSSAADSNLHAQIAEQQRALLEQEENVKRQMLKQQEEMMRAQQQQQLETLQKQQQHLLEQQRSLMLQVCILLC